MVTHGYVWHCATCGQHRQETVQGGPIRRFWARLGALLEARSHGQCEAPAIEFSLTQREERESHVQ